MNTSEPHTLRRVRGRHVAPKPSKHTTAPKPRTEPVAANVARITPPWESEPEAWSDSWLTADDRKGWRAA
jgi:hypothetical protein